ncbi:PH domain-containing protein [Streptomyces sp. NPDC101191]|uniref:PH domain-containing protein n=1 Tax=Streptomyces sp. NPDC101191 TaxID=3366126 RepID=UPI0038152DD1
MTDTLEGRLHPITPWRRAWAITATVAMFVFRDLPELAESAREWPRWLLALLIAGVALLAAGYGYGSWRKTSYRLTQDALHYSSGIVFHRRRRFELAHLQAADIRRPLLGRLIGVCTLRLSVAGQSSDLAYLGTRQAAILHRALLSSMARDTMPESKSHNEDTARTLMSVSPRMLTLAIVLDARIMISAAGMLLAGLMPYLLSTEPLALFSLAGVLAPVWRMTARAWIHWFGWRVTQEPGGYRTEFGLFDTQHHTLRHQRTQSLLLEQPVLWRRKNWVRISVATAGHAPQLLAPVATYQEAQHLVRGLYGQGAVDAMETACPAPHRARWATPFSRALSYRAASGFLCVWRGLFLRNVVQLCPASKIQGVGLLQGPWQRRLRLATVRIELAGGPRLKARHRDADEAAAIAMAARVSSIRAH